MSTWKTPVGIALLIQLWGCGAVNGPACKGGGTASASLSAASADSNANGAAYSTSGIAENVHTSTEVSGTYTLCGLGLTDTNRTLQFEVAAALVKGMTYPLTSNHTGNGTFMIYAQGGADPTDQRSWLSQGGSITLTDISANSATVTFDAKPMMPIPQNGNTAAKGTFEITGTATINF